jgi:hypothetical protein
MTERASLKDGKRPIDAIVRDLKGLLTPLSRPFDAIDQYTLNHLFAELEALAAEQTAEKERMVNHIVFMMNDLMHGSYVGPKRTVVRGYAWKAFIKDMEALKLALTKDSKKAEES